MMSPARMPSSASLVCKLTNALPPEALRSRLLSLLIRLIGAFTFIMLMVPSTRGQTPLSPKSLGMGGSYTAAARGYEALRL